MWMLICWIMNIENESTSCYKSLKCIKKNIKIFSKVLLSCYLLTRLLCTVWGTWTLMEQVQKWSWQHCHSLFTISVMKSPGAAVNPHFCVFCICRHSFFFSDHLLLQWNIVHNFCLLSKWLKTLMCSVVKSLYLRSIKYKRHALG